MFRLLRDNVKNKAEL